MSRDLGDRIIEIGFKTAKVTSLTALVLALAICLTGPGGCLEKYNIPQKFGYFLGKYFQSYKIEAPANDSYIPDSIPKDF